MNTVRVQHARDVQVLLSHVERSVQVLQWVVLAQLVVVNQIWSVTVDQSAEGQAIFETGKQHSQHISDAGSKELKPELLHRSHSSIK